MPRHILFPTDFSTASSAAFSQVLELAVPCRSHVTLLHVHEAIHPRLHQVYQAIDPDYGKKLEQELSKTASAELAKLQHQLANVGVKAEVLSRSGHAGEQIVKTALRLDCDLIVLGSRGMDLPEAYLLGSTSNYVLHHTRLPVVTVPSHAPQPQL